MTVATDCRLDNGVHRWRQRDWNADAACVWVCVWGCRSLIVCAPLTPAPCLQGKGASREMYTEGNHISDDRLLNTAFTYLSLIFRVRCTELPVVVVTSFVVVAPLLLKVRSF